MIEHHAASGKDRGERAPGVLRTGALHFVLNSAAGDHNDDAVTDALSQVMGAAGRRYQLHCAPTPADLALTAAAAVRQAGGEGIVVAVGGDGTTNTVASAVLRAGGLFGLVPRGTFNYFAREHGIPLEVPAALQLLLDGVPQPVQLGRLNERLFLVNASLGAYPDLLEDREQFKRRFGRTRLVALGAALRSVMHMHTRLALHIEADGQGTREVRVSTLFVGNNGLQFERLGLPEADSVGRSTLAALALRAFKPGELFWLAVRGALGRLAQADNLSHFAFRRLTVHPRRVGSQRRMKVAIDGEVTRLPLPLQFAVESRPLWMIKPTPTPEPAGDA